MSANGTATQRKAWALNMLKWRRAKASVAVVRCAGKHDATLRMNSGSSMGMPQRNSCLRGSLLRLLQLLLLGLFSLQRDTVREQGSLLHVPDLVPPELWRSGVLACLHPPEL